MDDIVKIAQYTRDYVEGLRRGIDKFAGMLPILTEQHIRKLANERLNTTKDVFLDAVKTTMEDYILVVELDADDWLANAVESGADPFNMKETHLKSSKARLSKPKKGGISYRYMRIPIGKQKDDKGGSTDKSQNLQKKINEVMQKPNLGIKRLKVMMDGSVYESQKVLTSDPDLGGLYQVRKYGGSEEFHSAKSKPRWNLVMFRTISENPLSKSQWNHPGIKPANIFKDTQAWLNANVDEMMETFIQNELSKIGDL
jgi:hypothetical protein